MRKMFALAPGLVLLFAACEEDNSTRTPAPTSITLSATSLSAVADGETLTLDISAPYRPLVQNVPAWITYKDGIFDSYRMTATFVVGANTLSQERSATLTVAAANTQSVTFTITQAGQVPVPDPVDGEWESARSAVKNMGAGWNLGNTLDANSGDVGNMWIEGYSSRTTADYETAWGQPVTTRDLIHMFKEAGFNAIRVPVTWYPHMGTVKVTWENDAWHWDTSTWTGYDVDPVWMARVKEVVDYVIDEGMYCILNVHHDTGAGSTAWLVASEEGFEAAKARYQSLWEQIALTFKDYGPRLLFEAYNEMLDPYDSWCFASFATASRYDASVAASAYNGINSYARLFTETVRATGGNNADRNLVVNTYGGCSGDGTWNTHLKEPLTQFQLPEEPGHIAVQVHSYWDADKFAAQKADIDQLFVNLNEHLEKRLDVPVIIGEWGGGTNVDNTNVEFAGYFSQKAHDAGFAAFWWMGLSNEGDRSIPAWTMPRTKDAILKPYLQ